LLDSSVGSALEAGWGESQVRDYPGRTEHLTRLARAQGGEFHPPEWDRQYPVDLPEFCSDPALNRVPGLNMETISRIVI
jgi:hypothetical protein